MLTDTDISWRISADKWMLYLNIVSYHVHLHCRSHARMRPRPLLHPHRLSHARTRPPPLRPHPLHPLRRSCSRTHPPPPHAVHPLRPPPTSALVRQRGGSVRQWGRGATTKGRVRH